MKKILDLAHFAIIGTGIGAIITTICAFVLSGSTFKTKDLAIWLIASAIMGMLTMLIYSDKIHLAVATLIHSVCTFGIVLGSSAVCGYGESIGEIIKNILPIFFAVYIVIYFIFYLIAKINSKKINEALNN